MIDFYLIGIARSGTSVAKNVINLHEDIYCGTERFLINYDPYDVVFPDSFFDKNIKGNPRGIESVELELKGKNLMNYKRIGDKLPRKFYCPSHLKKVKNNLLIYRNYKEVTASWDVRAKNPNDDWSKNRTGVFVFLDLLVLFRVVSSLKNVAIIDYEKLFYGNYSDELRIVFDALKLKKNNYNYESFKQKYYNKKRIKKKKRFSEQRYEKIADRLCLAEFENSFKKMLTSQDRFNLIKDYANFNNNKFSTMFSQVLEEIKAEELNILFSIAKLIGKNFTIDEIKEYFPINSDCLKSIRYNKFIKLVLSVRSNPRSNGLRKMKGRFIESWHKLSADSS